MSRALIKYIRLSPTKARLIAREIQGMNAELAMASLKFMPNKGAKFIANAISSAVANGGFEASEVSVISCRVDAGSVLRRFTPRARGSASRIRKPTSHILVEVGKIENPAKTAKNSSVNSAKKAENSSENLAAKKAVNSKADSAKKAENSKAVNSSTKTAAAKKAENSNENLAAKKAVNSSENLSENSKPKAEKTSENLSENSAKKAEKTSENLSENSAKSKEKGE